MAEDVVTTFEEAGIPRDKVEDVLVWAIGEDFHRIQIRYWPHRLRERLGLDVKESDRIKDTLPKIAEKWKRHVESTGGKTITNREEAKKSMKTAEQVRVQRDKLQEQLERMMKHVETIDKMGIEAKDLYRWAKCVESGREALDWVLADDSYVNIVY